MSGALPTTRSPAQVTVTAWSPTLISRAQSLKTQRRRRGAAIQRWKLHFEYGLMERTDYLDLWAFLGAQRGQWDTFTAALPANISPRGSWGGAPLVNGAVAAGLASVAIDGLTPSIAGTGKRGDFIKFAGHSKVYQLTADADANGSGQATLALLPALGAALADNEGITFSSVPFTLILAGDEQDLALQPPTLGTLAFDAIEDF